MKSKPIPEVPTKDIIRIFKYIVFGDLCWEWWGSKNAKGYGRIQLGGTSGSLFLVHRIMYSAYVGEIPDGLLVCHSCDNPSCCNPEHLFLGTEGQNTHDALTKDRLWQPRYQGEMVGNSKLNEEAVVLIREAEEDQPTLARRFNVSQSLISLVQSGKIWRHIR